MMWGSIAILDNTSAWYFFAAAIVLVAIDIFWTNDSHLTWVGVGVAAAGVLNAVGFGGEVQIIGFAAVTTICLIFLRRTVMKMPRHNPRASRTVHLEDREGLVLDVDGSIRHEGRASIVDHGEWRVREIDERPLSPGDRIVVVEHQNLMLLVRVRTPAPKRDSELNCPSIGANR